MAKFDDQQIDIVLTPNNRQTSQIHAPAGQIPAIGPDVPYVSPTVASLITPVAKTTAGVRFASPA